MSKEEKKSKHLASMIGEFAQSVHNKFKENGWFKLGPKNQGHLTGSSKGWFKKKK